MNQPDHLELRIRGCAVHLPLANGTPRDEFVAAARALVTTDGLSVERAVYRLASERGLLVDTFNPSALLQVRAQSRGVTLDADTLLALVTRARERAAAEDREPTMKDAAAALDEFAPRVFAFASARTGGGGNLASARTGGGDPLASTRGAK